eukprot:TRINITY_DN57_c0_g1_i1.p1 TRINITY_DN57_c0_g1~~TRINITY_DN57_c0_g1_i1.p1  ORF type:complete len:381 (-),score=82.14 TRINITY_DN57_c0_g1_i1:371-1513(-)
MLRALLVATAVGCIALADHTPPRVTLDLDAEPLHRWDALVERFKPDIQTFFKFLMNDPNYNKMIEMAEAVVRVDRLIGAPKRWFPDDQYVELQGIAKASGVPLNALVVLNLFYDLTAHGGSENRMCTSIVVQNDKGEIVHGRNLDYNKDLIDTMSNLTAVIDWQRAGKTVFTSVSFVPMLGFDTVVKPGVFSISHDERDAGSMFLNLFDAFARRRTAIFSLLRLIATDAESFDEAKNLLTKARISAPSYFIVAGTQPGEGAIITRDRDHAVDVFPLNASHGRWYIVETNYDRSAKPPSDDDRRHPTKRFLNKTGQVGFSDEQMMAALSNTQVNPGERATLNGETIYTAVISAKTSPQITAIVRSQPRPVTASEVASELVV